MGRLLMIKIFSDGEESRKSNSDPVKESGLCTLLIEAIPSFFDHFKSL